MFAAIALAALVPTRVHTAPTIDGSLDDWRDIASGDVFTQSFPNDGAAPNERTHLRVAYDDDNIYVAIDCEQTAAPTIRLTRRDRQLEDDRVFVDFDTAHDHRSAFHFEVSSAGVMVDGLRYDDTEESDEWDEVWRAEVAHRDHGWSVELAIPLRILRLRDNITTWGFQVKRWIGTRGEEDRWAYAPRDAGGEVSRYGELGPFEGLAPRGSLSIVPFVLSRLLHADTGVVTPYANGLSGALGLDLTWRPSPAITVQTALYPDFGQVEADQLVINLTTTEIEYPEKRPFFLEGIDLFKTPIQLLYTRRIGANAAQLVGAAKVVATAGPVTVGALSAETEAIADSPAANHHVVRLKVAADDLTVGALATAQTTGEDPASHPIVDGKSQCVNGALVVYGARCNHDAVATGLDAAWRSREGAWTAHGQLAASRVFGGPPRQFLDGTVMRAGDGGLGGTVKLAKEGGTLRGDVDYEGYSRRFSIDDLGYLERQNLHHFQLNLEAYSAHPAGPFADERARFEAFYRSNLDGLVGPSGYQVNVSGTTVGLWEVFFELHWRPHYFDDRELGDGHALQRSGRLGLQANISTDRRSVVVGSLSSTLQSTAAGFELDGDTSIELHPRPNIELAVEPTILVTRGEPRFVDGGDVLGPRFARQQATAFGVTTRATWTLWRDLTIQGYLQALLASIRYRDPLVADPALRVIELGALQPGAFDPAMYDTRQGTLAATIVGRWEYRPGSTAYVVYSHAQTPADGTGYEPRALVRGPASDALLFKLSWALLR